MISVNRITAMMILLLLAMTWSAGVAQAFPSAPAAAGCHHPQHEFPKPAPVSHDCCVAGHSHAFPTAAVSFETALVPVAVVIDKGNFLPMFAAGSLPVSNASLSPPAHAPLRI